MYTFFKQLFCDHVINQTDDNKFTCIKCGKIFTSDEIVIFENSHETISSKS